MKQTREDLIHHQELYQTQQTSSQDLVVMTQFSKLNGTLERSRTWAGDVLCIDTSIFVVVITY